MCRSTETDEQLHDALQDSRQIPIILQGMEKLGGHKFSIDSLADLAPGNRNKPSATSMQATSFDREATTMKKLLSKPPSEGIGPTPAAVRST